MPNIQGEESNIALVGNVILCGYVSRFVMLRVFYLILVFEYWLLDIYFFKIRSVKQLLQITYDTKSGTVSFFCVALAVSANSSRREASL